jgi:hypothetical protein
MRQFYPCLGFWSCKDLFPEVNFLNHADDVMDKYVSSS